MSDMEHDAFFEAAQKPGFPNEFAMQIERPPGDDPLPTFSQEGIENLRDTLMKFLMARVYATHKATGRGPKKLRATIKLDFGPNDPRLDAGPFYHLIDTDHAKKAAS